MRKKKFLARKKTRALKEQSLAALRAIKTPARHAGHRRRGEDRRPPAAPAGAGGRIAPWPNRTRSPTTTWSGASPPRSAARRCTRRAIRWCSAASTRWSGCAPRSARRPTASSSASSATRWSSTPSGCRKSAAALVGFARDMREREIEKITIQRGVTREELRTFIFELPDRKRDAAARDPAAAEGGQPHRHRPALAREGRRGPGHRASSRRARSTAPRSRPPSSCGRRPSRATSRTRARRARSSTAWRSWSAATGRRCWR